MRLRRPTAMTNDVVSRFLIRFALAIVLFLGVANGKARADGPGDNVPGSVRPVPPPGVEVPKADRVELEQGVAALGEQLKQLAGRKDSHTAGLLPDVQVFHKAVHDALVYNEF